MNYKKILTISSALLLFHSPALVLAQTASPSGSQIRDAVQKKVNEELAEIKKSTSKKAFVGIITAKSDATITLTNLKNQSRSVTVTPDTTVKLIGGKDGTLSDLKVDLYVLAMGDADSQNILTAKRLLVIVKPVEDKRKAVFGTVTKFTSSTLTIQTPAKESWVLKITKDTKFDKDVKFADIDPGAKIVVIGSTTSDSNLTASRIHVVTTAPSPTSRP